MKQVQFTYQDILDHAAEYICNACDNISSFKYDKLPSYVKSGFSISSKLIQTFRNNVGHGDGGLHPTVTWSINTSSVIPNCSTITKANIYNNIKNYANITNIDDLTQHPSANGLIVFLNKIIQFCNINLSFYSQIFDTSNTSMNSDNDNLPFIPGTYLVYNNITDYSTIDSAIRDKAFYHNNDLIYADNIDTLFNDLINIIKNNINIKTIQYSISFNR